MVSLRHKNILEIISKDLKSTVKNPIVVIVLLAIIILPSLYALLNIAACWDIYGNTEELDFAIANLDKGATYGNMNMTLGNDLVEELKNNSNFNWHFVSEEELRMGVIEGDYAAGIIIPENFSSDIVSITTDDPHQAQLKYIVNRKENPMSPRLSDTGANTIYKNMNAKIVEFINLAAYGKLGDLQSSLASGSSKLAGGASQLQSGASKISSGASQVSSGAGQVSSGASQVSSGADAISNGASQVSAGASQLEQAASSHTYPQEVTTLVHSSVGLANSSSTLAQQSSNLAGSSANLASGSSKVANGALTLAAGSQLLASSSSSALLSASSSLATASNSLSSVTGLDEDQLGDYFYSPIKLNTTNLYKVNEYGSEVAAFYIVLSMWVGGVITCVMVKPGQSTGTKYEPVEIYFGKLALFIILSILQATVTIIGALLLGIEISNMSMFLVSCYITSAVFMLIAYSLVSALGQVGKAINVVLLVLQIQATGGIYPIELMNPFFQLLYPLMPMTYAITMIRESTLGLLWDNYIPAIMILILFSFIVLFIAVIIKGYADEKAHWFEEKLKEVDLFW